ncbi:MAG: type II and III secretion system protein [Candidatus Margulisiibacteriota bacterium]
MTNRSIIVVFISFLLVLFLSSCSSEKTISEKSIDGLDSDESVEVSKIPTPLPQTPEAVRVFDYPPEQAGTQVPAVYRQSYETIDLKHIDAKKACEIMARIAPETVFMEGAKSSQLIVKGSGEDISRLKKVISSIDLPLHQIMIESRVVEISENALENIGVSWTGAANGIRLAVEEGSVKSETIYAVISALISSGKARLIASPCISTLDNQEASVNIGSKIPFAVPVNSSSASVQWAVQYIDAGVSLKITPRLHDKGYLTVAVNPEVSSVSEWRMTSAGEFPVISTRNANTRLKVRDGQTIVIGGLINEIDRENIAKIPFAGDIPFVKELFTKRTTERTKTEVVFLITPRII